MGHLYTKISSAPGTDTVRQSGPVEVRLGWGYVSDAYIPPCRRRSADPEGTT